MKKPGLSRRRFVQSVAGGLFLPPVANAGLVNVRGSRLFTQESGGNFIAGEDYVITGSGFGTRGDFGGATDRLNFAYLDFETGIEEDGFAYNQGPGDADYWTWMSTGNRNPRSTHWARRHSDGGPSNVQYLIRESDMTTGKFFFSCWYFNTPTANGKAWRLWYDNRNEDLWMNLNPTSYVINNDEPNGFLDPILDDTFPTNTWTRLDIYMRNGGLGMLIDLWRLGINGNSPIYTKDFGATFQNDNIEAALGAGEDGPNSTVGWGYDCVYMDFTPARVELVDTPVYVNRTKAEIQIPKAWADGTITVDPRPGSFVNGETGYLFVITDSNAVVTPSDNMVIVG